MPSEQDPVRELEAAADAFAKSIAALPADVFLRRYTDWSPRDVTAHLIGWNEHTLTACHGIPAGRLPFYFADMEDDFSHLTLRWGYIPADAQTTLGPTAHVSA